MLLRTRLALFLTLLVPVFCQAQGPALPNNTRLFARLTRYDYARYNRVNQEQRIALSGSADKQTLRWGDTEWEIHLSTQALAGQPNALEQTVEFRLLSGEAPETVPGIDLDISGWKTENHVLLPGAAYNGNRFDWRRIAYSPKLLDPRDIGADKPTIVSDIPKLNKDAGLSRIQERSGSMSTPMACFWAPQSQQAWYLSFAQGGALGDYGLNVEESRDRSTCTFSLNARVVREWYKYRITDSRFISDDQAPTLKKGDIVRISYRLYAFSETSLTQFYERYFRLRKQQPLPTARPNVLGFSACFPVQEKKYNSLNWVEEHGYYAIGLRENFLQDWQIGWTGGMILTYPLLYAGSPETQQRVIRNFDWLFPKGIAPSGFFWDSGEKGTIWHGGDIRKPHTKNWHLVRKSGDGLYFCLKQVDLMKKREQALKPTWEAGLRSVADAFVKLWDKHGQFGQFVDSQTGDVVVGGSTSGGIVPGALVLAYKQFGNSDYLRVAQASARYYAQNFVAQGLTTGGPGDAMQNPDSESCYALLESYLCLYEATGSTEWLTYARQTAAQFSTWVVSYDYRFPENSLFGKLGVHSTGAVMANTQNKHGAPGICTFSGDALWRLYRATGDAAYLDLLQDIAHNMPQYLAHPSRPIEKAREGFICERVSTTDWLEGIGEITYQTTWAEAALMLTYIEIPGVYVDKDRAQVFAFDHVEARLLKKSGKGLQVELYNPTSLPLEVSLVAETGAQQKTPLPLNALLKAKKIRVAAGERVVVGV